MKEQLMCCKTWEERYRLLIQAGKNLERPTEQELSSMPLIEGCEAKLWFAVINSGTNIQFRAYSEARIMNGLLWLLLQEIEGKCVQQLKQFQITDYFNQFGIAQRLSHTRLNGLKQIEQYLHQL